MRKLTTYWTSCAATLTLAGALGCGSDSGGLRPEALPAGQAAAKLHVTGRVTKGAAMRTAAPGAKNLSAAALADGSTLSITYAHTIRSAGASLAPRVLAARCARLSDRIGCGA